MIDGKEVRKWLFGRLSRVLNARHDGAIERKRVIVEVEAFSKDHAVKRLEENFPTVAKNDWDYLDDYDYDCDIGAFGQRLPLGVAHSAPRKLQ